MIWLFLSYGFLLLAFCSLWARQRRLERENTERTVALTRFLNAQLDLNASHVEAIETIPDVVAAEVRRALVAEAMNAPPVRLSHN